MKLTIHRGTHEIGGSCVELSTETRRLILDVGMPLVDSNRQPFDQRSVREKSIADLMADGTLPKVSGLFEDGPAIDGILLSHNHLDHSGLLHLTREAIPIYASSGTSKMMLAGAIFGGQQQLDRDRYRELKAEEPIIIGDFTITPFAVDHSSFGSLAFLIEADGKTALYSGDLRSHGRKPGMARTLLAAMKSINVDVMLAEGTHFGRTQTTGKSEYDLEEEITEHIRSAPGIVLSCFSPIDIDRLVTYYRATKRAGRTFVADAYTAFVMHLVSSEASIPSPTRDTLIRVYHNRIFAKRKLDSIAKLFTKAQISLVEIVADPAKYVMAFRPSMRPLDFDRVLPTHSRVLYSYWQGYLKRADWVELQAHLDEIEGDFVPAHTSGHIYIDDLVKLVNDIDPKMVVPIHTFEPELFHRHFNNVRVLDDGEELELS